jgi:hypothetical protein
MVDKSQLNQILSAQNEKGETMLSRVNGVQVIAFQKNGTASLMIGRLAEWKDKKQSWALSAGKPEGTERLSAAGLEIGAYRELLEEFGIPESWGQKSHKVLVNDAGKFGVKLVFFHALQKTLNPGQEQALVNEQRTNIATELARSTLPHAYGPEYTDWMLVSLVTFETEMKSDAPTLQWRKFDKAMFGNPVGLALILAAIASHPEDASDRDEL